MRPTAWLAIDLGTTHTVAVVGRGDQRPRALVFDDSPLLASGVFLDTDGVLHTGNDARRLSRTEPDRYEPYPKRRIDDGTVLLGERELPVGQLFGAILRRVASEAASMNPEGVVLTHPADWGPVRRAILTSAAAEAGFENVRLIPEPIAAAAYCTRELEQDIPDGGTVAIFDFGGGTFDVTVVQRGASGSWKPLATGGLDDLGGLDVDNAVVGHLGYVISERDPALWQRIDKPTDPVALRDRQLFWAEARAGKEMLSRTSTAPVALPGDALVNVHVTRDELTRLAEPLVARAIDETRRTLQRAEVKPADLSMMLLVGGSSRMPQVASALHSRLGIVPLVPEQPELPVAYGALLHAMDQADDVAPPPAASHAAAAPNFPPPPAASHAAAASDSSPPTSPPTSAPPSSTPPPPPPTASGPVSGSPSAPSVLIPTGTTQSSRRVAIPLMVILAVVLVAALIAGIGLLVDSEMDGRLGRIFAGETDTGETDAGDIDGGQTDGSHMASLFDHSLSGGGAAAVAATGDTVLVGDVALGETTITALSVPDGTQLWSESYELEPTELYLTTVGDLLIVDATSSATDGGDDVRAVVSLADGELMWKKPWSDRLDVAVYGSELVVEQRAGIYDNMALGIDLATGNEIWRERGPDGLFLNDEQRIHAMTYWDDGESGDGALLPTDESLYDNLVAGPTFVDLIPETGEGVLRDAATGESVSRGSLPLDGHRWTAFEDFAVGELSDDESPGRSVLAAYDVDGFSKAWELPLDVSSSIQLVKPCGPGLVCAAIDTSGSDDGYRTVAVDVATGKEAWSLAVEWSLSENWYTTADGILFGDQVFDTVDEAWLLDFDGGVVRSGETFVFSDAVRDGLVVFHTFSPDDPQIQQVVVVDTATGEETPPTDIGIERPEATVIAGGVVVVLTAGGVVKVFDSGFGG